MVDVLPPVGAYPKWEVNGTATEGYITISVMQNGSIFVKQEMKTGAKTLLKTLQAINNAVTIKEEPMDEDDPVSANPSSTQSTPATVTSDGCSTDQPRSEKAMRCYIKINLQRPTDRTISTSGTDGSGDDGRHVTGKRSLPPPPTITHSPAVGTEPSTGPHPLMILPTSLVHTPYLKVQTKAANSLSSTTGRENDDVWHKQPDGLLPYHLRHKSDNNDRDSVHQELEISNKQHMRNVPSYINIVPGVTEEESSEEDEGEEGDDDEFAVDSGETNVVWDIKDEKDNRARKDEYERSQDEFLVHELDDDRRPNELPIKARHLPKHMLEPGECAVCKKQFSSIYMLQVHLQTTHLECPSCKVLCRGEHALKRHMKKCTRETRETTSIHLASKPTVGEITKSIGEVKKRAKNTGVRAIKTTDDAVTPPPGKTVESVAEVKAKVGRKRLKKMCDICKEVFNTSEELDKHNEGVGKCEKCEVVLCGELVSGNCSNAHRANCTRCPCSFGTRKRLAKHMERHDFLECKVCGKRIKGRTNLKIHQKVKHSGENIFPCDICGKQYKNLFSMEQHRIAEHGLEGRYKCEECGKQFFEKHRYNQHMRLHTGEKPYKCQECGKAFSIYSSMYVHKLRHTDQRPYKCEICGSTYVTKYNLTAHMNKHNPTTYVECDICFKKFGRNDSLKCHKETHTNERRHRCKLCGVAYNNRGSLSAHMKKHRERGEIV